MGWCTGRCEKRQKCSFNTTCATAYGMLPPKPSLFTGKHSRLSLDSTKQTQSHTHIRQLRKCPLNKSNSVSHHLKLLVAGLSPLGLVGGFPRGGSNPGI
eukprot:scaffold234781_cov14-Prasinocladus_malaysianus.AAC.1